MSDWQPSNVRAMESPPDVRDLDHSPPSDHPLPPAWEAALQESIAVVRGLGRTDS